MLHAVLHGIWVGTALGQRPYRQLSENVSEVDAYPPERVAAFTASMATRIMAGTLDNLRHLRTMRRLIGIEYQGVVDDHRVAAVVLRPVHSTVGASEEGIEFSKSAVTPYSHSAAGAAATPRLAVTCARFAGAGDATPNSFCQVSDSG